MPQIVAAATVFFSGLGAGAGLAAWLGAASVRLLTSVALGALYSQLAEKSRDSAAQAGIRTSVTQTGGINPTSFVLGTYATSGYLVCPPMSHGLVNKTPNAYMTYVIEIADIRRVSVSRVIIDGEYATLGGTLDADGFYPVTGRFADYARVKFYDGTQTAADPWLLTTYGSYPDRPWTSDMIGRDQSYAIVVFRFNSEIYNGFPQVRFEVTGIPLYDPRFDTTVGGSGAQRWATPSTWAASSNPMVQIYNICRGIAFADGSVWGGGVSAADLPLTEWFAAMNACDVATALLGGGTEAAYRSGFEVRSDDEPAAVVEELLKACSGQMVDMGGVWKPKVGSVGLPVLFITDDDLIVTRPQEFDPFPNLSDTHNGVAANYPEPISLYESVSAPIRTNATDETADGGRRLIADLSFSAVPYKDQVQRLMEAYRLDNRRFRRHGMTLGPPAMVLEPTDSISWTSSANGYSAKVFEVGGVTEDMMTALQRVTIRERDSADYAWNAATDTKAVSLAAGARVAPPAQSVPLWAVTGGTVTGDVPGVAIPAIFLTWDGTDQDGVDAIRFQIRRQSDSVVIYRGSTHDVESGARTATEGIAGSTTYQARARFVANGRATPWTSWLSDTSGAASYVPTTGLPATSISMTGGGTAQDYAGFETRADFVTWAASKTPDPGTVIFAAGFAYRYIDTGTTLSDLPGWLPEGDVYPDHFVENTTPGTTDMAAAMRDALAYSGTVRLDGVKYAVRSTVAWDNANLIGNKQGGGDPSIIEGRTTGGSPIPIGDAIIAPGRSATVRFVQIGYNVLTGLETTDERVGLDTRGLTQTLQRGSVIDEVRFDNVGTAISDYGDNEFSVTFGTIEIAKHSYRAVDLRGENRTGTVWLNVYINGAANLAAGYAANGGFYQQGQSAGGMIGQLNVEHTEYLAYPVYIAGLQGLVINSLHIEGVDCSTPGRGYVGMEGASVTIHSLNVTNTRMSEDDTAVVRLLDAGYQSVGYSTPHPDASQFSELKVGVWHVKGLASPNNTLYPSYPIGRTGVRNCDGFGMVLRDPSYTDLDWTVETERYLWAVFPAQSADQQYIEFPECFWARNFIVRRWGDKGELVNPTENLLMNGAFDKWVNTTATITTATETETANRWMIRQVTGSMTADQVPENYGGVSQFNTRVTINTAGTYQGFTQDFAVPVELLDQPMRLAFEMKAAVAGQVFEQISFSLFNPAGSPTYLFQQVSNGGDVRSLADTDWKTHVFDFDAPASSGVTLGAGATLRVNFAFNDITAIYASIVTFRHIALTRRANGRFNRHPYDRLALTTADLSDTALLARLAGPTFTGITTLSGAAVLAGDKFVKALAATTFAAAATLTNADLQSTILRYTGAAASLTFPLGSTLDALIADVDTGFEFSVINTGAGDVTMAANTGVTRVGSVTVVAGTSARWLLRKTAASTFIAYRLS